MVSDPASQRNVAGGIRPAHDDGRRLRAQRIAPFLSSRALLDASSAPIAPCEEDEQILATRGGEALLLIQSGSPVPARRGRPAVEEGQGQDCTTGTALDIILSLSQNLSFSMASRIRCEGEGFADKAVT